jgi:hypothetical protein
MVWSTSWFDRRDRIDEEMITEKPNLQAVLVLAEKCREIAYECQLSHAWKAV